ncbi:methyltransferase [Glutamicibacter sp. MNS18]|uniref:DUF7059 domain-containing protein n=1 Tax=Glutamicibacter sp. MNS18 TaxID=2989817 RepID=UPI0022365C8C|nr:methyltransferase [Glutamicibacter sp. MNS18]MCW4464017.1 methyltransferase [Glutamicibacter sp. MNS18]
MTSTDFASVIDTPSSANQQLLDALHQDLDAAGFRLDPIAELLGSEAMDAFARDQITPALWRLAHTAGQDQSLATVIRLFQLGQSVGRQDLDAVFERTGCPGLLELGLLEEHQDGYRAAVALTPHASDTSGELWVAHDLGAHQRPGVLRTDHVLGIGHASTTLAQITLRPRVRRALDLGTGCGIQLFHLLAHADHVTATDLSERALGFARFNLLLNHRQLRLDPADLGRRVSLRAGNLFEPVRGELFDLIASNPPFVITPRQEGHQEMFTYRDGGMAGDRLVRTLIEQLPAYLNPGGSAQMLANWEIPSGEQPWHARIGDWFAAELDVWVIQREQSSPSVYAETWLRDSSQTEDLTGYQQEYEAYLNDFATRAVGSVGFGYVYLAKPGSPRSTHRNFEAIGHPVEQPLAPYLQRDLETLEQLRAAGESWIHWHLEVAEDVTEERHQRPGAEHPGVILLRQGAGLRRSEILDTAQAGFISACDGELSINQLANALDALIGEGEEDFMPTLLSGVERLIRHGFLRKV